MMTHEFKHWQNLKKKGYSDRELCDFFIEVVRDRLPELIGTKIEIEYMDIDNIVFTI